MLIPLWEAWLLLATWFLPLKWPSGVWELTGSICTPFSLKCVKANVQRFSNETWVMTLSPISHCHFFFFSTVVCAVKGLNFSTLIVAETPAASRAHFEDVGLLNCKHGSFLKTFFTRSFHTVLLWVECSQSWKLVWSTFFHLKKLKQTITMLTPVTIG